MLFPTTEPSRCCLLHIRSRWWSLQLHSSWNRARFMSTYLLLDPNLPIGWKILDLNIWSLSWASKGGWGGGKGSGRRMSEEIGGWGRKWGRELWWGCQPWQHEFFILSNGEGCVDSFCFFLLWRLAIFVLLWRRGGGGRYPGSTPDSKSYRHATGLYDTAFVHSHCSRHWRLSEVKITYWKILPFGLNGFISNNNNGRQKQMIQSLKR